MSVFSDIALDRDGNRRVITSNEAFRLVSDWTFVESTTGAASAHTLFSVTGQVVVQVMAFDIGGGTELDSGDAATLEVGTENNTAGIIAQTGYDNITENRVWVDNTPTDETGTMPSAKIVNKVSSAVGGDILLTIGTSAITQGTLRFVCLWRPLSQDGAVEVATAA